MGMFPGGQPSCLQLSRGASRRMNEERGRKRRTKQAAAAAAAAARGRESRNGKGEDAGVKNVSRARW